MDRLRVAEELVKIAGLLFQDEKDFARQYKQFEKQIEKCKKKIITTCKRKGCIYENLGQKECRELEDNFWELLSVQRGYAPAKRLMRNFEDWCANLDLRDLR